MAVVSIKNKLRRGNLLVGNDPFIPTDYESIATVSVGSGGAANVEFTSIPGTFTHLQVRAFASDDRGGGQGADAWRMQFNSDTSANYSYHSVRGYGSGVATEAAANASHLFGYSWGTSAAPNIFGAGIFDILDYANTNKYKTVRVLNGVDLNGVVGTGGDVALISGSWRNTNAITSIKIYPDTYAATEWNQYSHFALYGIKGA